MYLAQYLSGEKSILQALLRFPVVVVEAPEDATPWNDLFHRGCEHLLNATELDFAYRITLRDGTLDRLLFIAAPAGKEDMLRLTAGTFLQLNQLHPQSVLLCMDRKAHDAFAGKFPPRASRVGQGIFQTRSGRVMHDFRFFPLVEDVLSASTQKGWEISYQINAHFRPASHEAIRRARKNLAALTLDTFLPEALRVHQQEIVSRFCEAPFIIEELISSREEAAERYIADKTRAHFSRRFGSMGFAAVSFESSSPDELSSLASTGLHSACLEPDEMIEAVPKVALPTELNAWLRWQPPAVWATAGIKNMVVKRRSHTLKGATVINQGTMNFSENKTIEHMNTTHISVTLGNGVTINGDFVVANRIKESFSRAAEAKADDNLKKALQELSTLIGQALPKMPTETAAQASHDLQTMVIEATSPKPRKKWYELSADGLLEAAKTVGEMSGPITIAVKNILSFLSV